MPDMEPSEAVLARVPTELLCDDVREHVLGSGRLNDELTVDGGVL